MAARKARCQANVIYELTASTLPKDLVRIREKTIDDLKKLDEERRAALKEGPLGRHRLFLEQSLFSAFLLHSFTSLLISCRTEVEMERRGGEKLFPPSVRGIVKRLPTTMFAIRQRMSRGSKGLTQDELQKARAEITAGSDAARNEIYLYEFVGMLCVRFSCACAQRILYDSPSPGCRTGKCCRV